MFTKKRFGNRWNHIKATDRRTSTVARRFPLGSEPLEPRVVLSTTMVSGDFDGDGFEDLAIGVPFENVGGSNNAGAVSVIYGAGFGLTSIGDQFWTQDSVSVKDSAESQDMFGKALAVGDFNNDGYDDLAIGVPGEDVNGLGSAGGVAILPGSSTGLTGFGDKWFTQASFGDSNDPDLGAFFGSALAAGDFNGDGFDDLAVGAPKEDRPGVARAGTTSILFGGVFGLLSSDHQILSQDTPGVLGFAQQDDHFGSALSAGDFDGDGYDDLAIGVPGDQVSGQDEAGSVNVLYGHPMAGLSTLGDQLWNQGSFGIEGIVEAGDAFGFALASGDFDSDGYDDLAIGVPGEDVGNIAEAGAVNVIYGLSGGLSFSNDQIWYQGGPGILGVAEPGDYFGASLTVGNFNGFAGDDLAIGVPGEDVGNIAEDAGVVQVLYSVLGTVGLHGNNDDYWYQELTLDQSEDDDAFGWALASGDFDGDGIDDLAISIPGEDISSGGGGLVYEAGAVEELEGTFVFGLQSSGQPQWHQNSNGILDSNEDLDYFGGGSMSDLDGLAWANAQAMAGGEGNGYASQSRALGHETAIRLLAWDRSLAEMADPQRFGPDAEDDEDRPNAR